MTRGRDGEVWICSLTELPIKGLEVFVAGVGRWESGGGRLCNDVEQLEPRVIST
jgi:hypothetical protein